MSTGSMIVSVIASLACLLLAWRALPQLNQGKAAQMALIWVVIIAALTFLIRQFGA